jgi:hypothetical protein
MHSTGPLNSYLVREVGLAELLLAGLYGLGIARPAWRFPCWILAASWQTLRVLRVCVSETNLFWSALPFIVLPAALGIAISVWARKNSNTIGRGEIQLDDDWKFESFEAVAGAYHSTLYFGQEDHRHTEQRSERRA